MQQFLATSNATDNRQLGSVTRGVGGATKSFGATVCAVGAVPESLYYSLIVGVLPPKVATAAVAFSSQCGIDKRIRYAPNVCVYGQWRGIKEEEYRGSKWKGNPR